MAKPTPKATPIIITPPPPPPPPGDTQALITKRFDWTNFTRKLSTLVAAASVSYSTVATAIMGHYLSLTPAQQETWPWWVPLAMVAGPGIIAGLGPFAVAFRQTFLDDTDQAGV